MSRVRIIALLGLAGLLLAMLLAWRGCFRVEGERAVTRTNSFGVRETASGRRGDEAASAQSEAVAPEEQLRQVVAENARAGRMVFLEFSIARARGVRWIGASGAIGRAKIHVARRGPGLLHFEVFDRAGRLTYSGSLQDPTRRVLEHPANDDPAKIVASTIERETGEFTIRVPGETDPARIEIFRINDEAAAAPQRELLAEFVLR